MQLFMEWHVLTLNTMHRCILIIIHTRHISTIPLFQIMNDDLQTHTHKIRMGMRVIEYEIVYACVRVGMHNVFNLQFSSIASGSNDLMCVRVCAFILSRLLIFFSRVMQLFLHFIFIELFDSIY